MLERRWIIIGKEHEIIRHVYQVFVEILTASKLMFSSASNFFFSLTFGAINANGAISREKIVTEPFMDSNPLKLMAAVVDFHGKSSQSQDCWSTRHYTTYNGRMIADKVRLFEGCFSAELTGPPLWLRMEWCMHKNGEEIVDIDTWTARQRLFTVFPSEPCTYVYLHMLE